MSGFTKLVPEIIQSSIWNEPSDIRIVWITLLAVKDQDGYVRGNVATIARLANVPLEAAKQALDKFQQPDPASHTPNLDGRRIAAAPGGWTVVNHTLYRVRDHRAEHAEYVKNWRVQKANENAVVIKCDSQVNHTSASASSTSGRGVRGDGCGRPRNPLMDAIAICETDNLAEITPAAWKRIAAALKEIRTATPDVTPEEVKRRAENYRSHFDGAVLTASALAKHWARCKDRAATFARAESVPTMEKRMKAAGAEIDAMPKYPADQTPEQRKRIEELRSRIAGWKKQIGGG